MVTADCGVVLHNVLSLLSLTASMVNHKRLIVENEYKNSGDEEGRQNLLVSKIRAIVLSR